MVKGDGLRGAEQRISLLAMSTVAEIEAAIARLPFEQAEELNGWLEQWLEDQRELSPEFIASIERGKADIAAGRVARGSSVNHAWRGHAGLFTRV